MKERERLINCLCSAPLGNKTFEEQYYKSTIARIADYLLANGVLVPPVRIGERFYHTEEYKHSVLPDKYPIIKVECTSEVDFICFGKNGNEFGDTRKSFKFSDVGKTVFFTKEKVSQKGE